MKRIYCSPDIVDIRTVKRKIQLPLPIALIVASRCQISLFGRKQMSICHWLIKQEILNDPDCLFVWASKCNQMQLIKLLFHHYAIRESTIRLAIAKTTKATTLKFLVNGLQCDPDVVKCTLYSLDWLKIWKNSFVTVPDKEENTRMRETLMEIVPELDSGVLNQALFFACINGDQKMTKALLDKGVQPIDMCDWSIQEGFVDVSDLLITYGAHEPSKRTFLTVCQRGSSLAIKWFLDRFPKTEWPIEEGLKQASEEGQIEIVRTLLKAGADPTTNDNAASLLAVAGDRLDIYNLLRRNSS